MALGAARKTTFFPPSVVCVAASPFASGAAGPGFGTTGFGAVSAAGVTASMVVLVVVGGAIAEQAAYVCAIALALATYPRACVLFSRVTYAFRFTEW